MTRKQFEAWEAFIEAKVDAMERTAGCHEAMRLMNARDELIEALGGLESD